MASNKVSKPVNKIHQSDSELEAGVIVTLAAVPSSSEKGEDVNQPDSVQNQRSLDDEPLMKGFYQFARWAPIVYFSIGAFAIGVPLAIYMTIRKSSTTGSILTGDVILWLFVAWCSFFMVAGLLEGISRLCGLAYNPLEDPFNAARSVVIEDVYNSLLTFFTFCVLYGASRPCLCLHYKDNCESTWVHDFRKALVATLILSAVWLAKALILEFVYLRNARAFLNSRSLRPLRAWKTLLISLEQNDAKRFLSLGSFWRRVGVREEKSNERLLALYICGKGDDDFYERNECRERILEEWKRGTEGKTVDLAEVKYQLINMNIEARNDGDAFVDDAQSLEDFKLLFDMDGNGRVTLEECFGVYMEEIVPFFRECNKSVYGIKVATREVEKTLIVVIIPLAAIVYAAFFVSNFSAYATPLWTTLTGLSFAISGTVTSFINACSFVFGKQPYDVGDRVSINVNSQDQDLIVLSIHLHYTTFRRLRDSTVLQVGHEVLDTFWITNLSRSVDLQPQEEQAVPVEREQLIRNMDAWQTALRERIKQDADCCRHVDTDALTLSRPSQTDEGDHLCRVALTFVYRKRMIRREEHLAKLRERVWKKLREIMKEDESR